MSQEIPKMQTVALICAQGSPNEFVSDYPVPTPTSSEVLVKILYTGVCQSNLHTKNGTATGLDGKPITNIKLPHIDGHEGVGLVISHSAADRSVKEGTLVGVRFLSRVCHECEYCATDREQHCAKSTNHLHHEDGIFQEYIVLDTKYLTVLPDDVDLVVVGLTLCAGVTAYKAVKNAGLKKGEWLVVVGAGGRLGHFAVKYGLAMGAKVLGVDTSKAKQEFIEGFGAKFLDFAQSMDLAGDVRKITSGGTHAAVVPSGNPQAFNNAADMLRIGTSYYHSLHKLASELVSF